MNHTLVAAERHIVDLESRVERQAALVEQQAEPLAPWETPPMRIAQLAWGEGCTKPGGTEYLMDLLKPLALDSAKRVLEFGAGLGAGARAIHRTSGAQVAGYEVDAGMAKAGRQLCALARLDKAVNIVRYDPRQFTLDASSCDCVISTETLYEIERKEELLARLELGLKPRGQLIMTDLVLGPEASADNDRLKALAPGSATFWPADRYSRYLRERNFDLRASEDITAAYRKLIVDGCKRFTDGGPDYVANAKAYPEALFAFLEVWASRVAAFDSGLLKVMRFSAIKLSSPKLMSNW